MNYIYICNEVSLKNGWSSIAYYTIFEASKYNKVTVLTSENAVNLLIKNVDYFRILPDLNIKYTFLQLFYIYVNIFRLNFRNYDICHVLVEPYTHFSLFVNSKKKFISAVGTYILKSFNFYSIKNILNTVALYYCFDEVIAISKFSKLIFNNNFRFKKCNYVVTPGIEFNKNIFYKKKDLTFCIVGEIKKRKGVLFALKAFHLFLESYPNSKLIIAGAKDNSYAKECIEFVNNNHLSKRIDFRGHVENIASIYQESFCNILASQNLEYGDFEGFGMVHLEANSYGILTIGSLECGNECAIKPNYSGFLVKQNSYLTILEAMLTAASMYNSKSQFVFENCRQHALENLSSKKFNELAHIYDK